MAGGWGDERGEDGWQWIDGSNVFLPLLFLFFIIFF